MGEFHDLVSSHGGRYLEPPVLGSLGPSTQGALTVLVSGKKDAYDEALSYLQKIGKDIFYLQMPTLATRIKLVNNLVLGSFMAAIAEAVALGEAAGLERSQLLDILASGAGSSGVLGARRCLLAREDLSPKFQSALIYKDLHRLQDLTFELKRPLFMGSMTKELYGMTFSRGEEKLDFSALYRIMKEY